MSLTGRKQELGSRESPTGEEAEGEAEGRHCQEEPWVYHLLGEFVGGFGEEERY